MCNQEAKFTLVAMYNRHDLRPLCVATKNWTLCVRRWGRWSIPKNVATLEHRHENEGRRIEKVKLKWFRL